MFQVLFFCVEVVHVECLHGAQMLPFVCDVQYSYHVSTVHKIGSSLHYTKSWRWPTNVETRCSNDHALSYSSSSNNNSSSNNSSSNINNSKTAAATAVLVAVYHFIPFGTQGIGGTSPSHSVTRQPFNLTPCFAAVSCFLQNGRFQVCFCFPLQLAHCGYQTNACFSVAAAPFLRVWPIHRRHFLILIYNINL